MSGDRRTPGGGDEGGWVHGAWTTPAVVVRRPDGSVVHPGEAGSGGEAGRRRPSRARPRPRRIPGAPGAVLLVPTLTDPGGDPADRRLRRNSGTPATVTPLPPRVRPARDEGDSEGESAGEDEPSPSTPATVGSAAVDDSGVDRPARPSLRVVGEALRRGARPSADRQADRQKVSSNRTGETSALHAPAFEFDRLLPSDPERRAEVLARLRRVGLGVAAAVVVAVAVYTVFPVRTWLDLRAAEQRAEERQEVFDREIEILEAEVEDLRTPERVEEEARRLGFAYPGEETYGLYPPPEERAPDAESSGDGSGDTSAGGSATSSSGDSSSTTTTTPGG